MVGKKFMLATFFLLLCASPTFSCTYEITSPSQGFDRAQAVFTGRILSSSKSQWVVAVERAWKGSLDPKVTVFDANAGSSCSTAGYKRGASYLFLVNVESRNGTVLYSPQVCNWGTRLRSQQVSFGAEAKWIEDWVLDGRGQGNLPVKKSE